MHPLQYKSRLNDALIDSLIEKKIDVAIAFKNNAASHKDELSVTPLFDEALCAIVAKDHPLANSRSVSLTKLTKWTLIKQSGSYFILGNDAIRSVFESWGLSPKDRVAFVEHIQDIFFCRL